MKQTSQSQNQEKSSLESRLIATGILVGAGVVASLISRFSDNQIDSNSSLQIVIPSLGVGWVVGSTYLAVCEENTNSKLAVFRDHTINYATMTASYLGTYFIF